LFLSQISLYTCRYRSKLVKFTATSVL